MMEYHITDDRKHKEHPDKWKWCEAIGRIGMAFNSYQLRRGNFIGFDDNVKEYYRQYRFTMNTATAADIVDEPGIPGVCFVQDGKGFTVGIHGIEIRLDDSLPDDRVVLINGFNCVSFDWCGRVAYEDCE